MPSRTEGFGLVAMEAITAGVPLLVSEHSGVAELLRECLGDDSNPFVIPIRDKPNRDSAEWAEKIKIILLDQAAADRRAADLYDRLDQKLSWNRAASDLLEALDSARVSRRDGEAKAH